MGKDDIGVRHGVGRRIGPNGTALNERYSLGLGAVVDRDGITGVRMWPAMGAPIIPVPINATESLFAMKPFLLGWVLLPG